MQNAAYRRFRFVGLLTVVSIYLLILVGGIVRSTGSGMGCPDWPKCFGTWVPPTNLSQLPANYKEVYTAQRVAKNQKLALTLQRLGFAQVAGSIFAHPTQYIETDFNAVKTWIEYVNRLLGALIGVFVFLTAAFAWSYRRRNPTVFWLAVGAWLLTGVQGWLGSLVVSTNLLPVMVTIHMGLALLIVAMLLYAVDRAQAQDEPVVAIRHQIAATNGLKAVLWIGIIVTFGQIVLGTQVREQVDIVSAAANYANRASWVAQLGSSFTTHRAFSIAVTVLVLYTVYELWSLGPYLRRLAQGMVAMLVLEVLAGLVLAYGALPPAVQPVHLTLATILFGLQFLGLLAVGRLGVKPEIGVPTRSAHGVVA
ncbi:cytochrome oxidase assembly protein [Hymenobacter coccineus]|uniref:Cytochrome oxidase assembly protein n=2 Tax=Hymenobacter coccineus TaxID=1908235 RepID=A0A1G1TG08_9BACT|nr:cytochrome oxidase assembly protein [Hymenobacter coccineus]